MQLPVPTNYLLKEVDYELNVSDNLLKMADYVLNVSDYQLKMT